MKKSGPIWGRGFMVNNWPLEKISFPVDGDPQLYLDVKLKKKDSLLRYMDFVKFNDFLKNGLYMTRADQFSKDDPFEGEYTEQIYSLMECISSEKDGIKINGKNQLKEECQKVRRMAFVSCWTLGESENIALWKLYGGFPNAIALRTSVGLVKEEIEYLLHSSKEKKLALLKYLPKRVVKVEYIDHHNPVNISKMIKLKKAEILHYKNVGYQYEEEIRIIFDSFYAGKHIEEPCVISIRPEIFIQEIIVSPFACDYFFQSVKNEAKKYNISERVKWSDLKFVPGEPNDH